MYQEIFYIFLLNESVLQKAEVTEFENPCVYMLMDEW